MKNDLSCEVVQDLLPSYVDGLANDVTSKAVEEHLNGCKACSALVSRMRETMMPRDEKSTESWNKTVDAMIRNRHIRRWLYGALITLVLIMVIWIVCSLWSDWTIRNQNAGFKVTPTSWDIEVDDENAVVWLEVTLPDGRAFKNENQGISSYSYNRLGKTLTLDITCSYAWGASGETMQTSCSFFDWYDSIPELYEDIEAPKEGAKFSDYVRAIYIGTIDEPVWTVNEAE